jgi:hypothetical protein
MILAMGLLVPQAKPRERVKTTPAGYDWPVSLVGRGWMRYGLGGVPFDGWMESQYLVRPSGSLIAC